jgi:hypothetical protein
MIASRIEGDSAAVVLEIQPHHVQGRQDRRGLCAMPEWHGGAPHHAR